MVPCLDEVASSVAQRVGLQEGAAGVLRVLNTIAALGPVATRTTSRRTGIPVPIVAAICNELRAVDVLSAERPARLSARGHALVGAGADSSVCPTCHGHEVAIPPSLDALVRDLERIAGDAPEADVTIDQSHCTAETKVRRALLVLGAAAPGPVLFLGDDDLGSLTLARVTAALGVRREIAAMDVDARVCAFLRSHGVGVVQADLRDPVPVGGRFECVVTDAPYTRFGAELFLSRAITALKPGAGRTIMLCFGPKGPEDAADLQASIAQMRLGIVALVRNFNEYIGAGVLGGVSHLYHLVTTLRTEPLVRGSYRGPLYTREAPQARAGRAQPDVRRAGA